MSQPIPRPRWTPTKVKNCNQTQLLAAMGWDAGAFKLFRMLIQTRGDILGLDTRDDVKAQDPHKFQKLVDECVDAFPTLKNFTGYWPVEAYWDKYTNWRKKKKNNERKANGDPNTAPTQSNPVPKNSNASQESSSNSKFSRKRKERDESEKENETTYPNTAPTQSNPVPNDSQESSSNSKNSRKRKERDESEKENETTSTPPNPSQGASERTKQDTPRQRLSQGDVAPRIGIIASSKLASRDEASSSSSQLSTITSTLSSSPSVPPGSQPRSILPVTKSKSGASWRACVLCGYRPRVPDAQVVEIKACFHDRDDLQHILATIGVVADNHLRALLRLPQRKSESFLSTLVHETLDATEKVEILDMLGTYVENKKRAANRGRRDNKIQFTEIPHPPPGLVNVLSRNKGMHSYVKKHMKIAGDEEYFQLVEFIEAKIPKFLDVSKTYEEQQEEDIDAVVQSVCEDRPSTRRYEGLWPVRLHVRRFFSAQEASQPEGPPSMQREAPSSSPIASHPPATHNSLQLGHECPRQSLHSSDDLPASVAALLTDYEMKEDLGPAFLFMGVYTEEKFATIVKSEKNKAHFLAQLDVLELSVFQSMMMRYIIERF